MNFFKEFIQFFTDGKYQQTNSSLLLQSTTTKRNNIENNNSSSTLSSLKILSAETDLSYLNSDHLVGSYNPDICIKISLTKENIDDCVRCICGIMEDEGVMTQCDKCHFWLHADCFDYDINSEKVLVFFFYMYKMF